MLKVATSNRRQRKTSLHLPADWPCTPDLATAWQTIKTLPIPI
jgi:hypothetical protein